MECKPAKKGAQHKGIFLFEDWQIDFTPKPKTTGSFKYLLVFVDTFSEWVEAYPTRTEQETEVVKILLKEIMPRFGFPNIIQSNSGP